MHGLQDFGILLIDINNPFVTPTIFCSYNKKKKISYFKYFCLVLEILMFFMKLLNKLYL